jgi:hypothetical protein
LGQFGAKVSKGFLRVVRFSGDLKKVFSWFCMVIWFPRLSESLPPRLSASLSPRLFESLSPRLSESLSPRLSESLSPRLSESLSSRLSESLSPRLSAVLPPRALVCSCGNHRLTDGYHGKKSVMSYILTNGYHM